MNERTAQGYVTALDRWCVQTDLDYRDSQYANVGAVILDSSNMASPTEKAILLTLDYADIIHVVIAIGRSACEGSCIRGRFTTELRTLAERQATRLAVWQYRAEYAIRMRERSKVKVSYSATHAMAFSAIRIGG